MKNADDIKKIFDNAVIQTNANQDEIIIEKMTAEFNETYNAQSQKPGPNIWRLIMKSPITKLAAAAVIIICVLIGISLFDKVGTSVTFGEVLKNFGSVQTMHAVINKNGKKVEIWAKRPNMMKSQYTDETYEISNGSIEWIVDPKNNKATKKESGIFKEAQHRGVDVMDALLGMEYQSSFSGFFSEKPIGQTNLNGVTFDVYKMEVNAYYGSKLKFEALVNSETHLLQSLKVEESEAQKPDRIFEFILLEYDQPIPDELFVFKPNEGMQVTIEEDQSLKQEAEQRTGSTLSGRIIWASSGKPVGDARVAISVRDLKDPDGSMPDTETNKEGYWQIMGVPNTRSPITIYVQSWNLEWPAVPDFNSYEGTPMAPQIGIDGQSEYRDLNFKVYKPEDFYARITAKVTDEDGNPIENATMRLQYDEGGHTHQGVSAIPNRRKESGEDGRFNANNIWPTNKPVRIVVSPPFGLYGTKYAAYQPLSEPFTIEPKKSYHFDIVLPYVRQMMVQVLDTSGKPLEGVSVAGLDKKGRPITLYVAPGGTDSLIGYLTDSNGLAVITGMAPGDDMIITVKRLDMTMPDLEKPLATACFEAKAPMDLSKPLQKVIFDERPIYIDINVESETQSTWCIVDLGAVGQKKVGWPIMQRKRVNVPGKIRLQGAPAGRTPLKCMFIKGEDFVSEVEDFIDTKPGNTYTVKITEKKIELIDVKPNK